MTFYRGYEYFVSKDQNNIFWESRITLNDNNVKKISASTNSAAVSASKAWINANRPAGVAANWIYVRPTGPDLKPGDHDGDGIPNVMDADHWYAPATQYKTIQSVLNAYNDCELSYLQARIAMQKINPSLSETDVQNILIDDNPDYPPVCVDEDENGNGNGDDDRGPSVPLSDDERFMIIGVLVLFFLFRRD